MFRQPPHPLEGTALRAKALLPRGLRPVWERRAASSRVGDAFSALPADPARALRRSAVMGAVSALPVLLFPEIGIWPLVLFSSLLIAFHDRCRKASDVLPILLAGQLLHWLLLLAGGLLRHG